MTKVGFDNIEIVKRNNSWTILDEVEEVMIPTDLAKEFKLLPLCKP